MQTEIIIKNKENALADASHSLFSCTHSKYTLSDWMADLIKQVKI